MKDGLPSPRQDRIAQTTKARNTSQVIFYQEPNKDHNLSFKIGTSDEGLKEKIKQRLADKIASPPNRNFTIEKLQVFNKEIKSNTTNATKSYFAN